MMKRDAIASEQKILTDSTHWKGKKKGAQREERPAREKREKTLRKINVQGGPLPQKELESHSGTSYRVTRARKS